MTFDVHMQQLTAAVHNLTVGRTTAGYREVRQKLKSCIAADSDIALPASVKNCGEEEKAVPEMTKGSDGFLYYAAFTSQEQMDGARNEAMVSIPIVNFLAIVHDNQTDPQLGGVILNPGDHGGCAITLSECIRLLDEVAELLDRYDVRQMPVLLQ